MLPGAPVLAQTQPGGFVAVSKTVDNPSPVAPLQTIEFTIEAVGIGDSVASNVILQEIMPPELVIPDGLAAFTSVGRFDPETGQWLVGDLEPGQREVMTLPAIVVADPQPACIVNSVSAAANDSVFIPDRASAAVRLPGIERCADMAINLSSDSSRPRSCDNGSPVSYNFTVENEGPDAARNVVLTARELSDYRLPGFGFTASNCDGLTCRWTALQPGESHSVTATSAPFESSQVQTHSVSASVTTDSEDYASGNDADGLSRNIAISECQSSNPPQLPTPDLNIGAALSGGGGGCFIATAAYGTAYDARIDVLRQFRDDWLLKSATGRALVALYYRLSPPVADYIAPRPVLAAAVRLWLAPVILALTHPLWTLTAALSVLVFAGLCIPRVRGASARTARAARAGSPD